MTGLRDPRAGIVVYELLARWPDDAVAWTNLGTLYEKVGDRDRAVAAYQRALTLNPGLDGVAERRDSIRGGGRNADES